MEEKPDPFVEWTHQHYVKDDEYIPYGKDIEAFVNRENRQTIIRWEDSPNLVFWNMLFQKWQRRMADFWNNLSQKHIKEKSPLLAIDFSHNS